MVWRWSLALVAAALLFVVAACDNGEDEDIIGAEDEDAVTDTEGETDGAAEGDTEAGDAEPADPDAVLDGAAGSDTPSAVRVSLSEYEITTTPGSVPAGEIILTLVNEGEIHHSFLLLETPEPADALRVHDETGKVPDDALDEVLTRVDVIEPGETQTLVIDIEEADNYVLICNRVGHYESGMYADLTVAPATGGE